MTAGAGGLDAQVHETTAALTQLEQQLRATQSQVSGLGFFARGFVEKDIRGATGRSFSDWITAAARLRTVLTAIPGGAQVDARRAIDDELGHIGVLRQYLQQAPRKINMVPAAVLKPQQRAEFLQGVSTQEKSLQSLEAHLRTISHALASAG